MPPQSPNEFVLTSSVRTDIVLRLFESRTQTSVLLSEIDASDSAVYDALSTLRTRGLIRERDDGWKLTAHGHLIAESLDAWQSSEDFLARDPTFWKNHEIDVIPAQFRARLPEIGEYDIIRDTPQEPNRCMDVAISILEAADSCDITTPYFSKRHQDAVPTDTETRVLVTREVLDVSLQRYTDGYREDMNNLDPATLRLTDCQFASVVTDDTLKFELPTVSENATTQHDGSETPSASEHRSVAGTTAILISETDSAVQFGRDLFDSLWADSDPIGPYVERQFPELLE